MPPQGSGKHAYLNGGRAREHARAGYETGWDATDWNNTTDLDPTDANLACSTTYATWTPSSAGGQREPADQLRELVRGVRVLHLGRRLLAERGGVGVRGRGRRAPSGQREYPWGSHAPGTGNPVRHLQLQLPDARRSCTGVEEPRAGGHGVDGSRARGASSIWRGSSGSGTSTRIRAPTSTPASTARTWLTPRTA